MTILVSNNLSQIGNYESYLTKAEAVFTYLEQMLLRWLYSMKTMTWTWFLSNVWKLNKGSFINEVTSNFLFLDPLPSCHPSQALKITPNLHFLQPLPPPLGWRDVDSPQVKSGSKKIRQVQKLAISKTSTFFVLSSWNLVKMIASWGDYFHQVSWG